MLLVPCEQRVPQMQLSDYASEAPHIYFSIVGDAQDDFGSSIVSALNVRVNSFLLETTGPKVNNLDSWLIGLLQQHVLWFKISMDYLIFMQKVDGI